MTAAPPAPAASDATAAVAPHAPGASTGRGTPWRLAMPIGTHCVVDYLSFVMVALMPLLAGRIGFDDDRKALLLGLGPVASGLVQPLVAWLGDRHSTSAFGPLGMLVAGVAVGMVGFVDSFAALAVIYVLTTLGVGAFHPPAAAAVGRFAGRRRSIMLSVFFSAGMLGGVLGNVCSPVWVERAAAISRLPEPAATDAALRSLALLVVPAALGAAALSWATLGRSHHHEHAHARHAALSRAERRRRWAAFLVLYAGNAVRFPINMALVYLFIQWAERLTAARRPDLADPEHLGLIASALNGPLQAGMQVGMGGGGILLGLLLRPRIEKHAFVALPILGALPVLAFPHADQLPGSAAHAAAFALAVLAGVGFGGMFPVSLSLGQRLLPHRTALASGMLLGGAWCFGVVGAHAARAFEKALGLEGAFVVAAAILAASGVLMLALPSRLLREIDPH